MLVEAGVSVPPPPANYAPGLYVHNNVKRLIGYHAVEGNDVNLFDLELFQYIGQCPHAACSTWQRLNVV